MLQRLDGVIATYFPRVERIIDMINATVPLVVIENRAPDDAIPSVIIDDSAAEVAAVNHLCSLGHTRIAFISGLEDSDIGLDRRAGYLRGLRDREIGYDDGLVFRGDYSFESGVRGAEYFLSSKRRQRRSSARTIRWRWAQCAVFTNRN